MPKGNSGKIKKQCQKCSRGFFAKPQETWKFLCPNCYKEYYLPLAKEHSYSQIKNNLDGLYKEYKKAAQERANKRAEENDGDYYYFDWVEVKC
jgi:hypothetical protein